jgi:signal transduction histidine kinase
MRWPRRYGLWITLAFLALLLSLLGALQYRWIGEIGRAEAERRQAQLDRSTRRFVMGLDRELAQVMIALRQEWGPRRNRGSAVLERLSKWAIAEEMPLVSQVSLLSRGSTGEVTIETCSGDGSGCRPRAWTPRLEELRRRMLAEGDEPGPAPANGWVRPGELVESPLALLVPVFDRLEPPGERRPVPFRGRELLVIELDADYLTGKLLPQLAELNFGPLRESEFVVSVVRRKDRSPLYSSDPQAAATGPQRGDVEFPLPGFRHFGPDLRSGPDARPGPDARLGPDARPGPDARFRQDLRLHSDQPPDSRPRFPRLLLGIAGEFEAGTGAAAADAPWLLVVRHRGGSLEHALAAIRRRNLAISLGVLALLGAAAILLAIGAQRARDLARQQIELVASVSHELNTPLAAIRSAGQNLAHGIVTDPAQVQRYGTLIEHEGSRLTGLVAQVLDFAGIQSGSRPYVSEPVSLARVVDDVLADLGLVLEQSGLTVSKDVPAALPELLGDAAALRRVVANLLTNAVKFAASGGRVAINATRSSDGRTLLLRVEDAGPGIPPAERARVFEPFYRGAAAQRNDLPGAGLGLALVRRIVTAHGGRATIESAAGGGTAVVVELPVHGAQETP